MLKIIVVEIIILKIHSEEKPRGASTRYYTNVNRQCTAQAPRSRGTPRRGELTRAPHRTPHTTHQLITCKLRFAVTARATRSP